MSGTLDEVAIWGRELSANEIGALHASGVQGLPLDTRANLASGLLYHASMDVFLVPNDDTKYRQAFDLLEEASLP